MTPPLPKIFGRAHVWPQLYPTFLIHSNLVKTNFQLANKEHMQNITGINSFMEQLFSPRYNEKIYGTVGPNKFVVTKFECIKMLTMLLFHLGQIGTMR